MKRIKGKLLNEYLIDYERAFKRIRDMSSDEYLEL